MRQNVGGGVRRLVWAGVPAIVACVAIVTLAAQVVLAAEDDQQKGVALITRAAQVENMLGPGAGPFRLRAHVKLFGLVNGTREGEYLLMAASPAQWFESVRFPGYTELTGLYDLQRWRKRNVVDKPFRFHEISQLLNLVRHLTLPPNVVFKKLAQKTVGGVQAFCMDASPTRNLWQHDSAGSAAITQVGTSNESQVTLCFDPATGALLSAAYSSPLPRFEYEGQVTLGNKVFPKVLRCYEGKELVAEATIVDLSAEQSADPAGFAPPAGADKWPECDTPELPKLIKKSEVAESSFTRARRLYGTVVYLAEVGADGSIHDLAGMGGRYGAFDSMVQAAVKDWRYQPATCGGTPVPSQVYLAYTFRP